MRNTVFALAISLAAFAPVTKATAGDAGNEPVTRSARNEIDGGVRDMASRIASTLSREGPTGWLGFFDDDPGFLMAVDGKLQFDGTAAAKGFLEDFGKHFVRIDLTWTDMRVDPLCSNAAAMAASYDEALKNSDGTTIRAHGYFTAVAVRTPTGWKLRILHWSSIPSAK
jgi:hypothetical protein